MWQKQVCILLHAFNLNGEILQESLFMSLPLASCCCWNYECRVVFTLSGKVHPKVQPATIVTMQIQIYFKDCNQDCSGIFLRHKFSWFNFNLLLQKNLFTEFHTQTQELSPFLSLLLRLQSQIKSVAILLLDFREVRWLARESWSCFSSAATWPFSPSGVGLVDSFHPWLSGHFSSSKTR